MAATEAKAKYSAMVLGATVDDGDKH